MPKNRRRGHNEGAIYLRESDGRWVAVVNLGWVDGKRARKYLYGETRKEVADKLRAFHVEHADGRPVAPDLLTLGAFLARWLEDVIKPKRAPATYENYEGEIRRHIGPGLGKTTLKRLTPQDIQAYMRRKHEAGLAPRTVQLHHGIIRAALNQALRWGLVGRNVAALTEGPRVDRPERAFLTVEQAEAMLAAARQPLPERSKHGPRRAAETDRLEALWIVALMMGMRRGEVLALRWDDIDVEHKELRLHRQVQRVGGKLVFRETKTRSRRTLPLPDVVADALKTHRKLQLAERLLAGDRWKEQGLVFPSVIGTPLDPDNVSHRFKTLARAAGLPEEVTLHSLRHSCASFLIAKKVEPRLIMEILGHTELSTTMDLYGHILPALKREAANAMDATFGRQTEAS